MRFVEIIFFWKTKLFKKNKYTFTKLNKKNRAFYLINYKTPKQLTKNNENNINKNEEDILT